MRKCNKVCQLIHCNDALCKIEHTLLGDTKCGLSNKTGPPKLPPKILMGLRQTRGPTSTNDTLSGDAFFLSIPGTTCCSKQSFSIELGKSTPDILATSCTAKNMIQVTESSLYSSLLCRVSAAGVLKSERPLTITTDLQKLGLK